MTETEYAAAVTSLIAEQVSPDFEYPASFDADIHSRFLQRVTPEQAAEELLSQYAMAE